MNDCVFCKIVKGEIPSFKIYEDEWTYAFLDIAGDYEGHTLVIPKSHYKNIFDIAPEVLSRVMDTVKVVSSHYKDNCGYDGVNIINASEPCAEQTVFHLHIHIIPRKNNDGLKIYPEKDKTAQDFKHICEKLRIN